MSASPLPAHPLNRLGIALLIAALICWIGFHLLPIDSNSRGWELWTAIWELLTRGRRLQSQSMIGISAFLTIAILVTASPFVTLLLRASNPFRWLAIIASGAALLGLGGLILSDIPNGSALPLLLAAMALNFAGLMCIRPLRPG
jgi:hypothetical protein